MRLRRLIFPSLAVAVCWLFCTHGLAQQNPSARPHAGKLAIVFEENRGQASADTRYLAHMGQGVIHFTPNQFELPCADSKRSIAVTLHGDSAGDAALTAEAPTGGVANYYPSSDRRNWIEGVSLERRIRYAHLATGVDVVFHGEQGRLEYDLEVAPGADPSSVSLLPSTGAAFRLETDGSAHLDSGMRCGAQGVSLLKPVAYQIADGKRVPVGASFVIAEDGGLGLRVPQYDRRLPLTVDPVVAYSYIVGPNYATGVDVNNATSIRRMAVDSAGNLFFGGVTNATNYPIAGGGTQGLSNVSQQLFLSKLDPTGTQLLFSTYIAASADAFRGLALDPSGNVYIAGQADTPIPVTSQNLGTCPGCYDVGFVAKFSPTGGLVYSTLIGNGAEVPGALLADSAGNLYVAGYAADSGLKTVNALQGTYTGGSCSGCTEPFYAKLNPTGTAWLYASYFGAPNNFGSENDVSGIALDTNGNLYLGGVGSTVPLKNSLENGIGRAFVSEIGPDGKTLIFSTLLGGNAVPNGTDPSGLSGIQVGADGTIFVAGSTDQQDFPYTVNAARQPVYPISYGSGQTYIWAAAINPARTGLTYSTYLGDGYPTGTAMDAQGNFYVAGSTNSASIPLVNALDVTGGGFVLELNPAGTILNSTPLGGFDTNQAVTALAVDSTANIYVAGANSFGSTLVPGLIDPLNVGTGLSFSRQDTVGVNYNSWVLKIAPDNLPQISLSYLPPLFLLRNAGSADLHISSIQASGAYAGETDTCGTTVAAGTSCFLLTTFNPFPAPTGTLTINSDAQPASQSFTSSTSAVDYAGPLWIDSSQMIFPPQPNGTTSAPRPLKLYNIGSGTLTINSFLTFGPVSQTNNCTTIPALSYCTVEVTLSPSTPGSYDLGIMYSSSQATGTPGYQFRADSGPVFTANYANGPLQLSMSGDVNFGNTLVGQTSLGRTISILNSSTSPVTVNSPAATPSFTLVANTCAGISLASQQNCVMQYAFAPTAPGSVITPLTISGGTSSIPLYLYGTGVAVPSVIITPGSTNLGSLVVGGAVQQIFQVSNGGAAAVTLQNISVVNADATPTNAFSEQDNCSGSIAPSASCSVTVTVTPQTMGTINGTLNMSVNYGLTSRSAAFTATVSYPLTVSTTSLNFGQVSVGGTSNVQSVIVTNTTSSTVTASVATTGAFSITNNGCSSPLTAGAKCVVSLAFAPSTAGTQSGVLTVQIPGAAQSLSVALSGIGGAAMASLSASSLSFGTQPIANSSIPQIVTLSNTGNLTLSSIALVLSGVNAADYSQSNNCSTTLAAGSSCSISIVFMPSLLSTETAALTLNSSLSPQTVALSGTGVPQDFSLAANPSSATVSAGQSASYVLNFNSSLSGTVALSCAGLPTYASCSFAPNAPVLSSGTSSDTLTISTQQLQTASLPSGALPRVAFALALLFGIFAGKRSRIRGLVLTGVLLGWAACASGCAGGTSGSTSESPSLVAKGTYGFTATAISGTKTHTISLTLIVQ